MPPGKRRKVSQDEVSVRDGVGSRLVVSSDDQVGQNEENSPTSTETEKHDPQESKGETSEKTLSEPAEGAKVPVVAAPLVGKRSSTRVIKKKFRRDVSPQGSPVKKAPPAPPKDPTPKEAPAKNAATPEAKTKRQWESWQEEDIKTFYDALFEYGKDFDAIQNVVAQKCRKRGVPPSLIKNKDQVRHFYYRTIHKINKYIETSQDVKKDTMELYCLINYGILRDNIKCLNEKTAQKLKELIHNGITCVRFKGKNRRIRTPACGALKRLNNIEDKKEDEQIFQSVPGKIVVELAPKTNKAYSHVQSMAQNPRVKLTLAGGRSMSAIVSFLSRKWKERRVQIKETLNENETPRELTVYPHPDSKIKPVIINRYTAPKVDVTFARYKENVMGSPNMSGSKSSKKSANTEDVAKTTSDNSSESENVAITPPKMPRLDIPSALSRLEIPSASLKRDNSIPICPTPEISMLMGDDNAMFPDRPFFCESDSSFSINRPSTSAIKIETNTEVVVSNSMVENANHCNNANQGSDPPISSNRGTSNTPVPSELQTDSSGNPVATEELGKQMVEKAKLGWNLESGRMVTLAQVYLMCGEEGVVKLEYDWCEDKSSLESHLVSELTNMLRRLAHIATVEFVDPTRSKLNENAAKKSVLCSLCGAVAERSKNKSSAKSKLIKDRACRTDDDYCDTNIPESTATITCLTSASTEAAATLTPVTIGKSQVVMATSNKKIIPNSADGVFRVPMGVPLVRYPQAGVTPVMQSLQQKSNFLIQKRRRKVVGQKPFIVQRTLLPKAPSGQMVTIVPRHQTPNVTNVIGPEALARRPQSITPQTFSPASLGNRPTGTQIIASQSFTTGQNISTPILAHTVNTTHPAVSVPQTISIAISQAAPSLATSRPLDIPLSVNTDIAAATPGLLMGTSSDVAVSAAEGQSGASRSADLSISPPNLSSLLDMSLSCPPAGNVMADKILDMALVNSNSSFSGLLDSSLVKGPSGDAPASSFRTMDESSRLITPPTSPSHIGAGADTQWLNEQVGDMSLTSFLISPAKKSDSVHAAPSSTSHFPSSIFSESSQESIVAKLDVDQTLQVMMNENSMDYVAKFESLAAHIDGCASHRNKESKS